MEVARERLDGKALLDILLQKLASFGLDLLILGDRSLKLQPSFIFGKTVADILQRPPELLF